MQTINARDLHAYLGVAKDFSNWIKAQIKRAMLEIGQDYVATDGSPKRANQTTRGGDRRSIDYHITLDSAKHIAMMAGSDAGKRARAYFIACERKLKALQISPPAAPTAIDLDDPATLHALLLTHTKRELALEKEIATLAPRAEALDRIAAADGSFNMTDAAKTLQVPPRTLTQYMATHSWVYKRCGSDQWVAFQHRINSGLLEHKTVTITRKDGTDKVITSARITSRGLAKLANDIPGAGAGARLI